MNAFAGRLLRGLLRFLVSIGGWLLRQRARRTWAELAAYLRVRSDLFAERAERLAKRAELRAQWLRERARRWRAAATWLDAHGPDVDRALEDVEARARAGVDEVAERAEAETFERWRRARGR